jgi:VWFA-related protein
MYKLALPLFLIIFSPCGENLYSQTVTDNDSGLTRILFTAIDGNGNIRRLRKDEISLREDGAPQVILDFKIQVNPRTSVAIMIDTSLSQKRILPLSKSTAKIFVKGFVRRGLDRASIISFADSPVVRQSATDDVELLRSSIEKIDALSTFVLDVTKPQPAPKKRVGSTALIDSITFVCHNAFADSPDGARKAIVIFTDGADSSSSAKMQDAIESAIKNDIAIYTIALPTNEQGSLSLREDQPKLRRLAQETGGRAYFPEKNEDLQSILSQIELNLRAQYIVAFRSSATTQNRKKRLSIEILSAGSNKENAQLAYRRSY